MKRVLLYLVAIALIAGLIKVLFPAYSGPGKHGPMWIKARTLASGIEIYRQQFGEYPTGENAAVVRKLSGDNPHRAVFLNDLARDTNNLGEVVDSWGIPLRLDFTGTNGFTIKSAGSNKRFGDEDDIILHSPTNSLVRP
jgi:hypothetical protein